MTVQSGLRRKIWIAFILQVAAISFATVLGVYGASAVLKDVLIQRALTDEAGHFWMLRERDAGAPLPDTYNMRGFLVSPGEQAEAVGVPAELRGLPPGYHALPRGAGGALVLVEDRAPGRLYLVFDQEQVEALAFWFGALPLALVLMTIYVIAFFTYRFSRRAVSPVIWLAGIVQRWDPKHPDVDSLTPATLPVDVEGEVLVLANALHEFGSRIGQFLERERNFTRDASHELRTPLTVIRMACDLLLADGDLAPHALRSVQRVRGAARDMEALIESFLILAREGDTGLPEEDFVVNDVVHEEVDKLRPLLDGKPVCLRIEEDGAFALHGPSRALRVILANLLRNACLYTERGEVLVRIETDRVVVQDTGPGMSSEDLARVFEPFFRGGERRSDGHGIGLTLVRRLSERFGWPVTLESEPGKGTRACVRFPSPQPIDA
jgi:signal transduction histidine kinase